MSATINSGKLKFSVFGNGFDQVRNDSGFGAKSYVATSRTIGAMIDDTNVYMWLHTDSGLKKYRIADFTEVEQTTVPTSVNMILHPSNVANNLGLAIVNTDTIYIFDLTDDTLIGTVSGSFPSYSGFYSYDCVMYGNKIYFIPKDLARTNPTLYVIDLEDMTSSKSVIASNVGACGFVDSSVIYVCYPREWFYQTTTAYAINYSGGNIWTNTQFDNNNDANMWALVGNGKLYLPVKIDGAWHFGVFNATPNPTFRPPSPIRTIGNFDSIPALDNAGHSNRHDVAYNDGRTKACMWTRQGLLYTDFQTVEKLDSVNAVPLAMSDVYVVCSDYDVWNNPKLYIYGI